MDWTTIGGSGGVAGAIIAGAKGVQSLMHRESATEVSATERADAAEKELTLARARLKVVEEQRDALQEERSLKPILDALATVLGTVSQMAVGFDGLRENLNALKRSNEAIASSLETIAHKMNGGA